MKYQYELLYEKHMIKHTFKVNFKLTFKPNINLCKKSLFVPAFIFTSKFVCVVVVGGGGGCVHITY